MNYTEQSQAAGRHIFPDLTRAFALMGIVLVNVAVIGFPIMTGYSFGGLETPLDQGAFFAINTFFFHKSYTLFSFMFGVGFAYQMQSAERHGAKFSGRYWRRVIGLALLGALHIAFIFQGDILVMYALLGSLLFLLRMASAKALRVWAISVYAIQIVIAGLFTVAVALGHKFAAEDMAEQTAEMIAQSQTSIAVFGEGAFIETIYQRITEWSEIITFGMLLQGFGVFSFFLFGLLAVRSNIISNPSAPIWRRFRRVYLPIGVIGSAFGAYLMMAGDNMMATKSMFAIFVITLFAPFSTAGYLGLIAKWAERPVTPFKTFTARGGTASLTAYLLQGLILSLIFNNYGLGLYREIGAAGCIFIALLTGIFTIIFASLWRKKFIRGPMEYILRGWTYLGSNKA